MKEIVELKMGVPLRLWRSCLNRSLILPASELRTQEGKQNSSQPSPFAPPAPLISFALLLSTNDLIVRRFMPGRNTARACLGQRLPKIRGQLRK